MGVLASALEKRVSATAFCLLVLLVSALCALAGAASAFTVTLDSPAAGATVFEGENKFGFTAGGKSPMACVLSFNDVAAANATAQKNLPVVVSASLAAGNRLWSVSCEDANGEKGDSGARTLFVQGVDGGDLGGANASPDSPGSPGSGSGVLPAPGWSGFAVSSGGEREENALAMPAWRANPGRRLVFAALFYNDGADALNVSLKVNVSSTGAEAAVAEALESQSVEVAPGEQRVLQAEWTPRGEGVFTAEAVLVSGADGSALGKAFLQVDVVRPANVDWFFLLAFLCVAVLLFAVFKTRANAKAIRGGGLG